MSSLADKVIRMSGKKNVFDIEKVSLSKIGVNKYGGKSCYLNYDGDKSPLYLRLPSMKLTFNLCSYVDESKPDAKPKYWAVLSFNGMESNEKLKECYDKLKSLDNFMIEQGIKHSKEWFKKKKNRVQIEENYNPIIRQDDEQKYAPKFGKVSFRIDIKNPEQFNCTFYSGKNKMVGDEVSIQTLSRQMVRGTEILGLIQCTGVYFVGGTKFGLSWVFKQAKLTFPPRFDEYALGSDDDEGEEQLEVNQVEDSETESESESED